MVSVCHEVGFFYLTDHGVDDEFLDRYFGLIQAFFALPDHVKARIDKRLSPHFRGWERVGAELTDNRPDYREQLDVSSPSQTDLSAPTDAIEPDLSYLPLEPTKLAESPERAVASQQLALNVLSSVLGSAASFNGGARNADYFVIKQSECPAILVEMGYVTHPVEGQQLKDSNYLDRIAYGISYGVLEYLENSANGI